MGVIYVDDPATGRPTAVRIDGDQPSSSERERISAWQQTRAPQPAAQPAPPPEEESLGLMGGIGEFAQEAAGGFATGLTSVPGGLASLTEAALGYEPGSTAVGGALKGFSDEAEELVRGYTGETRGVAGKLGQTVGSLGSFFVPGLGAARIAQGLGAGARTAGLAGGAAASGMGAGLGTREQLARIENQIAQGREISDEQIRKALLVGGGIGLSEGLPVGHITGKVIGMLRRVPPEAQEEALLTLGRKLKRAGGAAIAEGGQEVFAEVAQDLTERGIYNPEAEIGRNAYDAAVYGGGAGGALQFVLDAVGGRRLRAGQEFRQDLAQEQEEAEQQRLTALDAVQAEEERLAKEARRTEEAAIPTPLEEEIAAETRGRGGRAVARTRQQAQEQEGQERALERTVEGQIAARDREQEPAPVREDDNLPTPLEEQAALEVAERARGTQARAARQEREAQERAMEMSVASRSVEEVAESPRGLDASKSVEEQARAEAAQEDTQTEAVEVPRKKKPAKKSERTKPSPEKKKIAQAVEDVAKEEGAQNDQAKQLGTDIAETAEPEPSPEISRRIIRPPQAEQQFGIPYTVHEITTPEGTFYASRSNSTGGGSYAGEFDVWNEGQSPAQSRWMGKTLADVQENLARETETKPSTERKRSATVLRGARSAREGRVRPRERSTLSEALNEVQQRAQRRNLGVDLDVQGVLEPETLGTSVTRGYMDRQGAKQVIALATDIYGSDAEMMQMLAETMDHETIHALRDKLTPQEWTVLTNAAAKQKKVGRNGKKRAYTYLQYEGGKNSLLPPEMRMDGETVVEEAVAEMFRDWAAGRLKLAGKPQSLFKRIFEFLKTMGGVLRNRYKEGAHQIFEGVERGEVGQRRRGRSSDLRTDAARLSGRQYSRAITDPRQMFYSPLLKGVEDAKQPKAPPDQWKQMVRKMPGVKPAEIEWTGLDEWLDLQEGSIPKDDVVEFLDKSQLDVVTNFRNKSFSGDLRLEFGDDVDPDYMSYADILEEDVREDMRRNDEEIDENEVRERALRVAEETMEPTEVEFSILDDDGNVMATGIYDRDEGSFIPHGEFSQIFYGSENDLMEEIRVHMDVRGGEEGAVTGEGRHEEFTELGGSNYQEILLRLPGMERMGPHRKSLFPNAPFVQSDHFPEENIVVHARTKDRKGPDGERTLFVEEIQSDLAKAARTGDALTPWEGEKAYTLMVKRLLRLAAHRGYGSIAWTPGFMQAKRSMSATENVVEGISWRTRGPNKIVNMGLSGGNMVPVLVNAEGNVVGGDMPYDMRQRVEGQHISTLLGNDVSRQIMESDTGDITDAKITFSDSGYAIAYDKQIKNAVDKFAKKTGAKVQVNNFFEDFGGEQRPNRNLVSMELDLDTVRDRASEFLAPERLAEIEQSVQRDYGQDVDRTSRIITDLEQSLAQEADPRKREKIQDAIRRRTISRDLDARHAVTVQKDEILRSLTDREFEFLFKDYVEQKKGTPVWYIRINDSLREKAMEPMPIMQTPVAGIPQLKRNVVEKAIPRLRSDLDRMGLKDVRLRMDEDGITEQGRFEKADDLAVVIGATVDPTKTIHHEAIHAMKELGLFTPEEWENLSRVAKTKWLIEHDIRNRYEGLDEEQQIEEAIAEAFGEFSARRQADGIVDRALDKIRRMVDAIKSAFTGVNPNQIFSDAYEGTVGARRPFSLPPDNPQNEMDVAFSRGLDEPKPQPFLRRYSRGTPVNPDLSTDHLQNRDITRAYSLISEDIARGLGMVIDKERATNFAERFVMKIQDRMEPIGRVIDELRAQGATIDDMTDTYRQEEVMHGQVGNDVRMANEELYTPAIDRLGEINLTKEQADRLANISPYFSQQRKKFMEDSLLARIRNRRRTDRLAMGDAFLYAKHAVERNGFVRDATDGDNTTGSGMSKAEADAILDFFRSEGLESSLEEFSTLVRRIVDDINRNRLEGGLISEEMADTETAEGSISTDNRRFDFWVPLRGKLGDDGELVESITTSVSKPHAGARGKEDPSITGRRSYAQESPLGNVLVIHQQSIVRGHRNRLAQSFAELARQNEEGLENLRKTVVIRDSLPMKNVKGSSGQVIQAPDMRYADNPNVVPFKEDGQQKYMELEDRLMARALNGAMAVEKLNSGMRAINKITRMLANLNTSWNPEFMLSNFPRDVETALVNASQYDIEGIRGDIMGGLKPGGGVWSTLHKFYRHKQRAKDNPGDEDLALYERYQAAGGKNMLNQMDDIYSLESHINDTMSKIEEFDKSGKDAAALFAEKGARGAKSILEIIENYNDMVENATRFAFFRALVDRGVTDDQAAQAARNLTTNFAKGGELKNVFNSLYLFFNASLQGSMALMTAARRSPAVRKIWAGMLVAGVMMDMINAMLSGEDEDGRLIYDKIDDYTLEHNLVFVIPADLNPTGDRTVFKIPLGYGLNMAVNAGRVLSRSLRGAYEPGEAAESMTNTVLETFNPFGDDESLFNLFSPTVGDPFIDILENEDFMGQPIYKTKFPGQYTADAYTHWASTSPSFTKTAQWLNDTTGGTPVRSGWVDFNPDHMEFWFDFLTGATGATVRRAAETPWSVAGPWLKGTFEEEMWREIPVARKVVSSVTTRSDVGDFMEKFDRIKEARAEYRDAREQGDRERLRAVQQQDGQKLRLYDTIRKLNLQRRKLEERKQLIENSDRPQQQKDNMIKALNEKINRIVSRGNRLMQDV